MDIARLKFFFSSSLFRNSSVYTLANILNASIPFLLIPILTKRLSTEDYGIIAMFTIMINIVSPFVGLSIHGAIGRKYFSSNFNLARYVGNCFFILFLSTLLVLIIVSIVKSELAHYTKIPANWLYAIVMISFSQFISLSLLTIWQVSLKPFYYGILQFAQTLLNFGLTLYFVIYLNQNWSGRLRAQLISFGMIAVLCLFILIKKKLISFEFNRDDITHALKFSLPLIPHTVGGIVISMTDRILITNMVGVNETGIYTVAFQVGSVLNLLTSAFNNAYVPWLFDKLNNISNEWKIKIVKFTYMYFICLFVIAISAMLILPIFLSFFVGKDFQSAGGYAVWIILGYVFNGMYLMVTNYIFYVERTKLLAWITLCSSLINIPLCYYLINLNGAIGAAQATTVVFFISFILTWKLSASVYKMPWHLKELF